MPEHSNHHDPRSEAAFKEKMLLKEGVGNSTRIADSRRSLRWRGHLISSLVGAGLVAATWLVSALLPREKDTENRDLIVSLQKQLQDEVARTEAQKTDWNTRRSSLEGKLKQSEFDGSQKKIELDRAMSNGRAICRAISQSSKYPLLCETYFGMPRSIPLTRPSEGRAPTPNDGTN